MHFQILFFHSKAVGFSTRKKDKMITISKKTMIVAAIIAVVAIIIGMVFLKIIQTPPKVSPYFTEEPDTWVEPDILSESDEGYVINLMKATGQRSSFSGNRQEYFYAGREDVFFSHGFYKGNSFETYILAPEFINHTRLMQQSQKEALRKNYTLMEISPYLSPEDGIIQGFIMAKSEGGPYVFYLFVDQDWRDEIKDTRIMYGNDFADAGTLKIRNYQFNEIQPGIYMDKIDDAGDWYGHDPVLGGIILGQISKEDIEKNNVNSTFILVR